MRIVVQRIKSGSVKIDQKVVGSVGNGIFVLLGIKKGDNKLQTEILANKLMKLRVMADEEGKMNLSVKELKTSILLVSQFTLYANTQKGNRPSFVDAEEPKKARKLYLHFIDILKNSGLNVETGRFGKYMNISLELDGPVTIIIESNNNGVK